MSEEASTRPPPPAVPLPAQALGAAPSPRPAAGRVLKGTGVSPGLVLGPVHRKDYDLAGAVARERVPRERIESELNRFHTALVAARSQLSELKSRLAGRVAAHDARILDTHVAYLKDSVFLSDVENLILNEQMALEAAIGKVVTDFDRIFRLVQNETLRERAVDLRDVGIRVLRHLEREAGESGGAPIPPLDYVLVARELSIVDMFNLEGDHVLGILTEEGGLTSHAAILARSMRIPTITGIDELLESVREGDFVIVDASEGIARLNPDELVRAQYRDSRAAASAPERAPAGGEVLTRDKKPLCVLAACGNLPEVEEAVRVGCAEIGLYRTELLYLVDRTPPTLESLAAHYRGVLDAAAGRRVTFRLLHADSSLGLAYLHEAREPNPALGVAGIRALARRESILRTQLQALLLAAGDADVAVAVPFVIDPSELRRTREVLFEERRSLQRDAGLGDVSIELGVVVETPAAVLGARDLAREAGFFAINLVALVQHVLACDRENAHLRAHFARPHPFVLRALAQVAEAAREFERPLSVFGWAAVEAYVPFLIGLGIERFALPPAQRAEFAELASAIHAEHAAPEVAIALCASAVLEGPALAERCGALDVDAD